MKRPMVDKQMRRLSSVKKMDLKVLNHDVDIDVVNMTGDNDGDEGGESHKPAVAPYMPVPIPSYTPVLETISSNNNEQKPSSTSTDADSTSAINHITNNASIAAADTAEGKAVNENKVGTTTTAKVNFDEKSMEEQQPKYQHDNEEAVAEAVDHSSNNTTYLIRLNSTLTSYDSFKTAHDSESVKQYHEDDENDDDDDNNNVADVKELKRENSRLLAQVGLFNFFCSGCSDYDRMVKLTIHFIDPFHSFAVHNSIILVLLMV